MRLTSPHLPIAPARTSDLYKARVSSRLTADDEQSQGLKALAKDFGPRRTPLSERRKAGQPNKSSLKSRYFFARHYEQEPIACVTF